MKLEKVYMDCIDEAGNCFIAYSAVLRVFFFRLHYSAVIFLDASAKLTERSSFSTGPSPVNDSVLIFKAPALGFSGIWDKGDAPLPLLNYESDSGGFVQWDCHHPKSVTNIKFNKQKFTGQGYAETLSFSVNPRNLPLDTLKWGRFLSNNYAVVWVIWEGKHPVNRVFLNGTEYNDCHAGVDGISFANDTFSISFSATVTVKSEGISDILKLKPLLRLFAGSTIAGATDNKYRSGAVLSVSNDVKESGWALYETVKFQP